MITANNPQPRPSAQLLADVFAVLDKHGYERAPGRALSASLPRLDSFLGGLIDAYEGHAQAHTEVRGA